MSKSEVERASKKKEEKKRKSSHGMFQYSRVVVLIYRRGYVYIDVCV